MNLLVAAPPAGTTRRLPQPLRHRVLLTRPVASQAALQRLHTFFDVEIHEGPAPLVRAALLERLHGKAGVMTDTRHVFDAGLVQGLPALKAVCNLDAGYHNLDLPALTRAGIRATHTPAAETGQPAWERHVLHAWERLQVAATQARAEAPSEGRYPSRWSRRVLLGNVAASSALRIAIAGQGPLARALAERARAARMAVALPGDPAHAQAQEPAGVDLWVWTDGPRPAGTPVLELRDTAGMAPSTSGRQDEDTEADTAEALIAALGFGRNSWHPPHLLNPEISCESCC